MKSVDRWRAHDKAQYFEFAFDTLMEKPVSPVARNISNVTINLDFHSVTATGKDDPQEVLARQRRVQEIQGRGRVRFNDRDRSVQILQNMFQPATYDGPDAEDVAQEQLDNAEGLCDAAEIANLYGVGVNIVRNTLGIAGPGVWEQRKTREDWAQRLEESRVKCLQKKLEDMGVTVSNVSVNSKCISNVRAEETYKLQQTLAHLSKSIDINDIEALEKTLAWASYNHFQDDTQQRISVRKDAEANLERLRVRERRVKSRTDSAGMERGNKFPYAVHHVKVSQRLPRFVREREARAQRASAEC